MFNQSTAIALAVAAIAAPAVFKYALAYMADVAALLSVLN